MSVSAGSLPRGAQQTERRALIVALFRRNGAKNPAETTKSAQSAPEQNTSEQGAQEQTAPQTPVVMDTMRVAAAYLQLYRWVFSISLDFGSYQIESGIGAIADKTIPIRGYYKDLLEFLSQFMLEDQRETFLRDFSQQYLRVALEDGYNCVSELFYINADVNGEEDEESDADWYEFRAEHIPDPSGTRRQLFLYVRRASGEKDTGRIPRETQKPVLEDGSYDWMEIRTDRLLRNDRVIYFEYDIANDALYTHRRRGDAQTDRKEDAFLATLTARADWMVFHENLREVQAIFKNAMHGVSGEAEIRYRKDGMQGANFIYYKLTCRPLEEHEKPTWLFGSLEDIDERARQQQQARDLLVQMDLMLGKFYTNMFQIDMNRGFIYHIVRTDTGFQREKNPQRLDAYIDARVAKGEIAPESVKEYRSWLQPNFLQKRAAKSAYEAEVRLKIQGSQEYRWYSETISAVDGRPGIFMRFRRDISEAHEMREKQFELVEKMRLSEYNHSMLDTMASLVEFRNVENGLHIIRVRNLTRILLTHLATHHPEYELTQSKIDMYTQASTIHDIGKITISDAILNKPGRYTPEEYAIMKTHSASGAQIVDRLYMPGLEELKACCRDVVLHHHERYDGRGYPEGLVGDTNAIGVQVIGLADVYDALLSVRCYKEAMSFEEAREMILNGKCGAFNSILLDTMKAVEQQMRALYTEGGVSKEEALAAEALLQEQEMTTEGNANG